MCGWHIDYLYTLFAFELLKSTRPLWHTRLFLLLLFLGLLCVDAKVLAPISPTQYFFFSHRVPGWNATKDSVIARITFPVPFSPFFFSFSPLLLCYLFICVGYVQSQSDARCHCCAEGNAFARPPGFSRFFFCATLAKPFKRYWQCLTYKSSDWIQPSPPLVNPIPVFLCRLMRLSL